MSDEDLAKQIQKSQGSKKCWSCETITPYSIGWCEECYAQLPPDIISALDLIVTEPWAGVIRIALADKIRAVRREPILKLERKARAGLNIPPEIQKGLASFGRKVKVKETKVFTPLNLDDLDI